MVKVKIKSFFFTSSFCSFSFSSLASSSGVFIFSDGWAFISKPSSRTIMSYSSSCDNKAEMNGALRRTNGKLYGQGGVCLLWVSPLVCRRVRFWPFSSPSDSGCSSTPDPASPSAPAPPPSAPAAPSENKRESRRALQIIYGL